MAAAKRKAAGTFTAEQVEAMIASAIARVIAPQAPAQAATHSLRPCDAVLVLEGDAPYKGSAGVVERLEGADACVVDMDLDHRRVKFPASALKLLKA